MIGETEMSQLLEEAFLDTDPVKCSSILCHHAHSYYNQSNFIAL